MFRSEIKKEDDTMKYLIALIAGLMLTTTANAQLVNIDFGLVDTDVYTGQGILGGATDTLWNSVDSTGAINLAFADGTGGTSGVSVTFNRQFSNIGTSATNTLLGDRVIGAETDPETITISGLTPNTNYELVLYNVFFAQEYSIVGQPGSGAVTVTPDGDSPTTDFPDWLEGVEYGLISAISDGTGILTILDTPILGGPFGQNTALAGLQIQEVPIPPVAWLFGSGLLGLVGLARRKKAA
jgi:hypothetical protein